MSKIKGAIVVDTGRCKGCSLCVEACPHHVIRLQVPVVARSCGFKSHLLHYFFSFVTNTRVAYKVGCEAQDVSFIQTRIQ